MEIAVSGTARAAVGRDAADRRPLRDPLTPGSAGVAPVVGKTTFRQVFGVTEFRALWLAQLLSVAGEQLARVAMTVLVYDRTHSALLTAATYAVTFVPWIIGGLALSGLADRLPRRQVMVACDVLRMALVCLMALISLEAPQPRRRRLMCPLAVLCCGVLVLCWAHAGLIAALVVIASSGACASYQLAANAGFVAAVPPPRRDQAFGLANGGMQVSQGLWIVLAGAAASSAVITPGVAIAISGGIGAVLAAVLARSARHLESSTGTGP
jgi:MFS family permease